MAKITAYLYCWFILIQSANYSSGKLSTECRAVRSYVANIQNDNNILSFNNVSQNDAELKLFGNIVTNILPVANKISRIFKGNRKLYKRLKSTLAIPEDASLSIGGIVTKYGYPFEVHRVTTEDGYVLTMHRIPHGNNGKGNTKLPPVFVLHGIFCSSDDWVVTGPGKGLGFVLADAGYDVWLGNTRGTKHSKMHKKLSVNHRKYWDFYLDEIATYDLPAMIDYILDATKERKLFLIAHSQGTMLFFLMCASRPKYNQKIRLMTALAPVGQGWCLTNPTVLQLMQDNTIVKLARRFKAQQFVPYENALRTFNMFACGNSVVSQAVCTNIIFTIGGYSPLQLNYSAVPVIMGHFPTGCSAGQLFHFRQIALTGNVRRYDFGYKENIVRYGSYVPPDYDFSKITAPSFLVYGKNDLISSHKTAKLLRDNLPNVIGVHFVQDPNWAHQDFLWAKDAKELVYDVVLKKMAVF